MPSFMSYQQIRRHLRSPRQIVLGEVELVWRLLRDCNIPEDPNWPSPTTHEEVLELMNRLPNWAEVVCAVTAAEMVLPIWDDWAEDRDDLDNQEKESPRRAIDAAKQWLDEEIDIAPADVETAADASDAAADAAAAAHTAADNVGYADADAAAEAAYAAAAAGAAADVAAAPAAFAAHAAARAAARAAHTAARAARAAAYVAYAADADDAAAYAVYAVDVGSVDYAGFYLDWWRVCRCRLSFILGARPF